MVLWLRCGWCTPETTTDENGGRTEWRNNSLTTLRGTRYRVRWVAARHYEGTAPFRAHSRTKNT